MESDPAPLARDLSRIRVMIKCVVAVLATTHTKKERAGESWDSPARSSFTLSRIALIARCESHHHGVPTIAKIPVLVT